MDTLVTPTAVTPGIASVGRPYGPEWSSTVGAEAALFNQIANHSYATGTENTLSTHFVRDAVERRNDAAELRAEIKALNANYYTIITQLGDMKFQAQANEAAKLRDENQELRFRQLIREVNRKSTVPVDL